MPGDGEFCPGFSCAFPLLDLHSHTKRLNNKSEMSIQLGLMLVSTVFGLVSIYLICYLIDLYTHNESRIKEYGK